MPDELKGLYRFGGVSLVPGVIALYHSLASLDRAKAAIGCGIMAVVIPVIAVQAALK